MPCRSDYLEPTTREVELMRAAGLLSFVNRSLGVVTPKWVRDAMRTADERCVVVLCDLLQNVMTPEQHERIVYDAHDKTSRDLATWWEDHLAADKAREKRLGDAMRRKQIKKQALAKLSDDERAVLGLHE